MRMRSKNSKRTSLISLPIKYVQRKFDNFLQLFDLQCFFEAHQVRRLIITICTLNAVLQSTVIFGMLPYLEIGTSETELQ